MKTIFDGVPPTTTVWPHLDPYFTTQKKENEFPKQDQYTPQNKEPVMTPEEARDMANSLAPARNINNPSIPFSHPPEVNGPRNAEEPIEASQKNVEEKEAEEDPKNVEEEVPAKNTEAVQPFIKSGNNGRR